VSEEFKRAYLATTIDGEERTREFQKANLLLPRSELKLLDGYASIGQGEFGGGDSNVPICCNIGCNIADVLLGEHQGRKVAVKTLKDGMFHDLLKEARFMM